MKKAIVFGGSGFVGSHVADALSHANIETTIFDINSSPYLDKKQKFIQGDILDEESVSKALQGMDYVYHLAGQADIHASFERPKDTLSLNINGTINILEACRKNNIERFVFASTVYVYSDAGGFYRASKQACEIIIEEYQKNHNIDYTILRYGSLYGPRASDTNFIHRLIKQALLEKKIEVRFGLDEKREFIHVQDAARMSVDILSREYINSRVMLTGYQYINCDELVTTINDMLGGDIKIQHLDHQAEYSQGHYKRTPYIFKPQVSKKLVSSDYIEFGQGLLICIEDIYEKFVIDCPESISPHLQKLTK
ncbi:NAD-dependent epimerase/dehydratase family protein [Candidatus Nucleicultrix amoebiphila]|jgi:UDP-glucose 4-epimerase|uniref:NAD-dependent epimerase/dehydratase family protein n=1 Tax=Candidatus Nucleicultrix amoebiphila TaxID=1509244 RepID=UPI000A26A0D6|nr:NAD-dependent epimerase/dehydratase family protein [Candidatus Nucleicultrix amoebiphila]